MGHRTSSGGPRQPRFSGAEKWQAPHRDELGHRGELGRKREERRNQAERRGRFGRDRRSKRRGSDLPLLVEAVFFYLYDAGRSIDLTMVAALVPAHPDLGIAKRRDTPASLTLPTPLILQLGNPECSEDEDFERLSSQAKIYEEGVVTIVVRVKTRLPMSELHGLEVKSIVSQGQSATIAEYAEEGFRRLFEALTPAVSEPRILGDMDRESYLAYCLLECGEDPATFIERNRDYCASLLIGEEPGSSLHESQIAATLGRPFSYRNGDLAVFELDRCIIIDPRGDYEDLLLIAEHANYQLLELRVLDKLLDTWLDEAEDDIRRLTSGGRRLSRLRAPVEVKVAHIQALRFDALFILENLENSSKIIGDYYLGQVYARLCEIFNTEGWKWSVERRLDTLQDVYDMVKADTGESRMVALEVTFIIVCIIFPIIQIIQVMITK
ncbi:MAG: hypothetical protein ABSF43_07895 [Rectinemataceae bacterium]